MFRALVNRRVFATGLLFVNLSDHNELKSFPEDYLFFHAPAFYEIFVKYSQQRLFKVCAIV